MNHNLAITVAPSDEIMGASVFIKCQALLDYNAHLRKVRSYLDVG